MITRYDISGIGLSAVHVYQDKFSIKHHKLISLSSHSSDKLLASCLEPLKRPPSAAVHRALGCRKGHRLVSSPARTFGVRRWNCGPLYPLLEHADRTAAAVHRHWLPGLQPGLVQAHKRTGELCCACCADSGEVKPF